MPPTDFEQELASLQKEYGRELAAMRDIPAGKEDEARALYKSYRQLSQRLSEDPAKVTAEDIGEVMTRAAKFFGIDWNRATRPAGTVYQFVSHPSALIGLVPTAYGALAGGDPHDKAKLTLIGQCVYAALSFSIPMFSHTFVFQKQFRATRMTARTTSDSVKSRTLKSALHELDAATDALEQLVDIMNRADEGKGKQVARQAAPVEPAPGLAAAYRRLRDARGECAKVQAKFDIEQAAAHRTTQVRGARVVVALAASLISFLGRNPRHGFYELAAGAVLLMLAQWLASYPDTANKARAQFRIAPRAGDVLAKAGLGSGSTSPDEPSPEELRRFLSALASHSLAGPMEAKVGLVQKRLEAQKRLLQQEVARIHDVDGPDSHIRLHHLRAKGSGCSEREGAERRFLETAYDDMLVPDGMNKAAADCRERLAALEHDIACLKRGDWDGLSTERAAMLREELNADGKFLPTLKLVLRDGLSDLLKPEQVGPLAINKCVQMFTMVMGGPTTPVLIGAAMKYVEQDLAKASGDPDYSLPKWSSALIVLGSMLALYGSRMGPYAATHTVQLRSDAKKQLEEGTLNIPAGPRMLLSAKFWQFFLGNLPGAVTAQAAIQLRMRELGKLYARSERLLDANRARIEEVTSDAGAVAVSAEKPVDVPPPALMSGALVSAQPEGPQEPACEERRAEGVEQQLPSQAAAETEMQQERRNDSAEGPKTGDETAAAAVEPGRENAKVPAEPVPDGRHSSEHSGVTVAPQPEEQSGPTSPARSGSRRFGLSRLGRMVARGFQAGRAPEPGTQRSDRGAIPTSTDPTVPGENQRKETRKLVKKFLQARSTLPPAAPGSPRTAPPVPPVAETTDAGASTGNPSKSRNLRRRMLARFRGK